MIDHRKPTAGFWITVALVVVLVAYPLSFGPAMWFFWSKRSTVGYYDVLRVAYAPIFLIMDDGPEPISQALIWYGYLIH